MSDRRTVRRSRGGAGRLTSVMAGAMLGAVELAIIAVLVVVPILTQGSVPVWNMVLCAILLPTVLTISMLPKSTTVSRPWC